jgi:hypothetical protein
MKRIWLTLLGLAALGVNASAATTINSVNPFAYGANIGWMDWRGDVTSGAVIGEFVCAGFIYAANVGWIDLGDGTPVNGIRYLNDSASDIGVNHDGAGNLRGFAWGANIGWLTFTNQDANGATYAGPKVDLLTGKFSGFIWSANCGWISLSNAQAFVQTDTIRMGADSDGDGLPDSWELLHFGNLTSANANSDSDGDGFKDVSEYLADTDPLDPNSNLRITAISTPAGGSPVTLTWTSVESRLYRIRETNDVTAASPWTEVGLGLIPPAAGPTTSRTFADAPSPQRFFRVEAVKPLSP